MKRALTSAIAVLMSALTLTACSSSDGFSDSEKISAKYPRSKDISVTYNYADGALEPPGSYNDFANSAGEFSLKLFRAYGSGKESFAFSPASTVLQLSMLCNAASPEVRSDITNALGGTLSTDELNACCSYFKSRMDKLTDEIRKNFYDSLEKDKNDEISDRMVRDISSQIEDCLSKMARIIEIPLG